MIITTKVVTIVVVVVVLVLVVVVGVIMVRVKADLTDTAFYPDSSHPQLNFCWSPRRRMQQSIS